MKPVSRIRGRHRGESRAKRATNSSHRPRVGFQCQDFTNLGSPLIALETLHVRNHFYPLALVNAIQYGAFTELEAITEAIWLQTAKFEAQTVANKSIKIRQEAEAW